mmetsp:Transcript_12517/g.41032  ORF Transcript_12517/g.41032 Transcript_12517/m.41032 type:complete len:294 (-) Transcript_12517:679-1560(-)
MSQQTTSCSSPRWTCTTTQPLPLRSSPRCLPSACWRFQSSSLAGQRRRAGTCPLGRLSPTGSASPRWRELSRKRMCTSGVRRPRGRRQKTRPRGGRSLGLCGKRPSSRRSMNGSTSTCAPPWLLPSAWPSSPSSCTSPPAAPRNRHPFRRSVCRAPRLASPTTQSSPPASPPSRAPVTTSACRSSSPSGRAGCARTLRHLDPGRAIVATGIAASTRLAPPVSRCTRRRGRRRTCRSGSGGPPLRRGAGAFSAGGRKPRVTSTTLPDTSPIITQSHPAHHKPVLNRTGTRCQAG